MHIRHPICLQLDRLMHTGTIATTSHRISSKGSQPYTYDAAGNTTGDGNNQFSYNAMGRMASSTNQNGLTTTYQYNALGQRIKKHNGNETTHLAYDAQGHIIGEYDAAGTATQETVWLYDTPIAVIKHNQVYAIYTDHLNTPREITNQARQTVWTWDNTEAFGDTSANQNPQGLGVFEYNHRFPGQLFDSETGTHYNYFRDNYAPKDGRYGQSDPIGLAGGINTYGYAENAPLYFVDEFGLSAHQCDAYPPPEEPPLEPIRPECSIPALRFICAADDAATASAAAVTDSSKNERHGDAEARDKVKNQLEKLEAEEKNATGKRKQEIRQKIQNIKRIADKRRKGETHGRRGK